MTAPVETYIQLPLDTGNTGKNLRTQSKAVGANTVHQHYFVQSSAQLIKGVYLASSTIYAVTAAGQNGTSSGVWWLQVPTTATINARIRRIDVFMTNGTATAIDHATAPRFAFARFTHTDSWSGGTITVCKRKTSDPASQADVRTASTGATVSLGDIFWAPVIPGMDITTSGFYNCAAYYYWQPTTEDGLLDLAPGEGLVCYQADAGTTSDQRKIYTNFTWDEYDNV